MFVLNVRVAMDLHLMGRRRRSPRGRDRVGSFRPCLIETLEERLCLSWSAPVNLGPPINTASYYDGYTASLTNNGLSLYFTSNRPGSLGSLDLWVSQRAQINDPWGAPQDLGPTINGNFQTHSANVTADGHWMYFTSTRPGGLGGMDIWRSYRVNTQDDFAWQEPENLGPNVNSNRGEACPFPFEDPQTGLITLYFASNRVDGVTWHIYSSTQEADGSFDPAVPVPELNSASNEKHFSVRPDGLMGILASDRQGTLGDLDLWVTTRASTQDPWSPPVNMGPTINSAARDAMPAWTPDGRSFFFESARDGGYGTMDLYQTTWQPSTWTVTTTADSGRGSLRAVIAAAFSGDRIVFDSSLQGQTITLTSGELAISKDLDIEGPGADQLAVSGNHQSRVFDISGGAAVTIAGLIITAGLAAGSPGQGGGILNDGSQVTVANDILSDNQALGLFYQIGRGGAIANVSGGGLTVTDSLFTNNQALVGYEGFGPLSYGGGIFNASMLTVTNSTFAGNTSEESYGGGIANAGTLAISESTFSRNVVEPGGIDGVAMGGGIWNSGDLTVSHTSFLANESDAGEISTGGGIANSGNATINYCTLASNFVGGPDWGGQGGAIDNSGTLNIRNSTIAHNYALGLYLAVSEGGGIANNEGTLSVSDSTIADNAATYRGGGIRNFGPRGTVNISNSTVAANSPNGLDNFDDVGHYGIIHIHNTVVAGNESSDISGPIDSQGHNLYGNTRFGSGFDATDLLDVDPLLGALADNGGPTQTMALLPGSPAIGAGDKTGHPRWDQRGRPYRRVVNHRMDIGAFEVQSDSPGPSAPRNGQSEGPILVPLISALPLATDACALCSVAPFRGSEATPSLNHDVVPKQEVESDPKAAAVDQLFTSLEEQAQRPRPVRWPDLEPIKFGGLHPDLFPEAIGSVL
jgi:Tol biopolymer transport system component